MLGLHMMLRPKSWFTNHKLCLYLNIMCLQHCMKIVKELVRGQIEEATAASAPISITDVCLIIMGHLPLIETSDSMYMH